MRKYLGVILVIFAVSIPSAFVFAEAPKPEQGKAHAIIDVFCKPPDLPWRFPDEKEGDVSHTVDITFWNVGEAGGNGYGAANINIKSNVEKTSCVHGIGFADKFFGGPNGKFQGSNLVTMRMINGNYIEFTYQGATHQIPVTNPEIFSKYSWEEQKETKNESSKDITDLPDVEYEQGVDSGARFSSIIGEVEMYPDGKPDDRSFAKMSTKIEPGMHIYTGDESNVIITFADMSTYKLPPNSEIVINNLKSKSQLGLVAGKIWGNIKKIANNETIEVETSNASLGIKGTTFIVEVESGNTILKMIEGVIALKSKKDGKVADVSAKESMTVSKDGLGEKSTYDPKTEEDYWEKIGKSGDKNKFGTIIYAGTGGALLLIFYILLRSKKQRSKGKQ